ncbi:MAG: alpha/beta fold hydrolase [Candidatus Harrisonbacteria bacterium]|nr:alpha/beta fold hydrolase [Candidatus Harrisonbacteria bacterium]
MPLFIKILSLGIIALGGYYYFFSSPILIKKVSFKSEDGVRLIGNYYRKKDAVQEKAVILVPGLPATRKSLRELATRLVKEGFFVLTLDLRGSGDSTKGIHPPTNFNEKKYKASKLDLEAAHTWLFNQGFRDPAIYMGGVGIGANLVLEYASLHPKTPALFALSPTPESFGIRPMDFIGNINPSIRILFLTSTSELENRQAIDIFSSFLPNSSTQIYKVGGHGSSLLLQYPKAAIDIINFFQ